MKVGITSNALEVKADMAALPKRTAMAVHAAVVKAGARLQRRVMANASGRPGPNAPTGDYRRSISRQTVKRANGSSSSVSSSRPQGPRLEFGFAGTDALGRVYDSPAFPHFGPALDAEGPDFESDVQAAVAEAAS